MVHLVVTIQWKPKLTVKWRRCARSWTKQSNRKFNSTKTSRARREQFVDFFVTNWRIFWRHNGTVVVVLWRAAQRASTQLGAHHQRNERRARRRRRIIRIPRRFAGSIHRQLVRLLPARVGQRFHRIESREPGADPTQLGPASGYVARQDHVRIPAPVLPPIHAQWSRVQQFRWYLCPQE